MKTIPDGFIPVDKPSGMTSHDVVRTFRRILGIRRIGHAGTLDPGATGLLVVFVGRATRLIQYLSGSTKVYEADILFGQATDTDDADGTVIECGDVPQMDPAEWAEFSKRFIGEIQQTPPDISAVHHQGKRAYERARRGETFELTPRTVRIDAIEVLSWNAPVLSVRVTCGPGTYIRSLARDWGRSLGSCAHISALRRTQSGVFRIENAVTIEQAEQAADESSVAELVNDPAAPLRESVGACITLEPVQADKFSHGMKISMDMERFSPMMDETAVITTADDELCGLGRIDESGILNPLLVWSRPD